MAFRKESVQQIPHAGKTLKFDVGEVDLVDLCYWKDNIRIRSKLRKLDQDVITDEDCFEHMWNKTGDSIKQLKGQIQRDGGLKEPIIIDFSPPHDDNYATKYMVYEGNRRLTCLKALMEENYAKWSKCRAILFSKKTSDSLKLGFIKELSINLKEAWSPYEKSLKIKEEVEHERKVDGLTLDEACKKVFKDWEGVKDIKGSSSIQRRYKNMVFMTDDHPEISGDEDSYSFWDAYLNQPDVLRARKDIEEMDDQMIKKWKSATLPSSATEFRNQIKAICQSTDLEPLRNFLNDEITFDDAFKIARGNMGATESLQKLNGFTKWIIQAGVLDNLRKNARTNTEVEVQLIKVSTITTSALRDLQEARKKKGKRKSSKKRLPKKLR